MNNGLCTSTWGNPGWFFLHCVSAGYPVDPDDFDARAGNPAGHTRRAYKSFFRSLGGVLPCRFCRESYDAFFEQIPIESFIHSRDALVEWVFKIHNKVNEKLGVEQERDLESVSRRFESFRARCPRSDDSKGCTVPAGDYGRVRCRVLVEPVDGWSAVSVAVAVSVSVALALVVAALLLRPG